MSPHLLSFQCFVTEDSRFRTKSVTSGIALDTLYSRRSSSVSFRLSVLFFIMFSLAQRRLAGADNPDVLAAIGMGHNQNLTFPRHSNRDEPLFRDRMIRVVIRHRQRIGKNRGGLVK